MAGKRNETYERKAAWITVRNIELSRHSTNGEKPAKFNIDDKDGTVVSRFRTSVARNCCLVGIRKEGTRAPTRDIENLLESRYQQHACRSLAGESSTHAFMPLSHDILLRMFHRKDDATQGQ